MINTTSDIFSIITANYHFASTELSSRQDHQSSHWKTMNESFKSFLSTPEKWQDFRRNKISQGMDDANPHNLMQQPEDMQNHLAEAHRQICQAVPPQIHRFLNEAETGNPRTYSVADMNLSNASVDFVYFAWRIAASLGFNYDIPLLFMEIGGGFGGLTRILKHIFPASRFILIDLPEGNATSSYFLANEFPDSNFFYLSNLRAGEQLDWSVYDFAILPGWCTESISGTIVDYMINTRSMQEMTLETIAFYFSEIQRLTKLGGLFYCVNRYKKRIGTEDIILADYPYDNQWEFLSSEAKWNQGHIHELLSRRLDGPSPNFPYAVLQDLPR